MLFFTITVFVLLSFSVGIQSQDAKVYGGNLIDIKEAPWTASIHDLNATESDTLICGGTIVTQNIVATSYYCPTLYQHDHYVRVGSAAHNSGGQVIEVIDYIFDADASLRFILLLVLENKIVLSSSAYPVALPFSNSVFPYGEDGSVSGWGYYDETYLISSNVRGLKTYIWTVKECTDYRANSFVDNFILFCAGGLGELNTCDYDGGAPLVVDGVWIGIATLPVGCFANLTSYYLSIPNQVQWIESAIANYTGISGINMNFGSSNYLK